MINENLYHKTVGILEQAYLNNTLEHGICTSCAVGNLVAGNMGIKVIYRSPKIINTIDGEGVEGKYQFNKSFWLLPDGKIVDTMEPAWWIHLGCCSQTYELLTDKWREGYKQILVTGYSFSELNRIEKAFENAEKGASYEDWNFNGLIAVIDSLDEIHENKGEVLTVKSKERFIKRPA